MKESRDVKIQKIKNAGRENYRNLVKEIKRRRKVETYNHRNIEKQKIGTSEYDNNKLLDNSKIVLNYARIFYC